MKKYIGTKIINAKPITRLEYNQFREWELPTDENGDDAGMLVEYIDGGKANTEEYNGYVSWSPLDVFNKEYKVTSGMTFGDALNALKLGSIVARKGWNGKGIFIALQIPTDLSKMTSPYIYIDTTGLQTDNPNAPKSLVPWLASQTDILSEDWVII